MNVDPLGDNDERELDIGHVIVLENFLDSNNLLIFGVLNLSLPQSVPVHDDSAEKLSISFAVSADSFGHSGSHSLDNVFIAGAEDANTAVLSEGSIEGGHESSDFSSLLGGVTIQLPPQGHNGHGLQRQQ